jgi:hypothetical protein
LLLAPARGQDDRLVTNPPLEQAFPLESKFGDVKLKFPVLLNSQTILGPDVTLRFIYVSSGPAARPPGGAGGGDGMGGPEHHHGAPSDGGDIAGSGDAGLNTWEAMADPTHSKGVTAKELQSETWRDLDTFQQALHAASDLGTMFVYAKPGEKPRSAVMDLPDGMLLGEVSGSVQVLALTDDSQAGAAGLQPGDQIQSIAAHPITSLRTFSAVYFDVADHARKANKPYAFQVVRPGQPEPLTITVGAPPSLLHML